MSLDRLLGKVVLVAGVGLALVWGVDGYNAAKEYNKISPNCSQTLAATVTQSEAVFKQLDKNTTNPILGDVNFIGTLPGRYLGYGLEAGIQEVEYFAAHHEFCK